ncbi:MAG TPA: AMP-binding protein, partial [Dehalococcoidia bacterium]|nr:AMP-binding protein [Dehalococcoidia bacterium]
MLTSGETEALARLVGELLANDAQFAAALPDKGVCETILSPKIGWVELMRTVAQGYADRPALGQRATETATIAGERALRLLPRFDTITYGELWQRVAAVAAALAGAGIRPGDRVATLAFCSVDYTTVDMAVPLVGAVSVPLHAGSPARRLQPMVDETEPSVIACSAEYLATGIELALGGPPPALLVVFDYHPEVDTDRAALDAARRRLADAGSSVPLKTLTQIVEHGRALPIPAEPRPDDDRLAVIIYTSGSSGHPKGAMHAEGLAKSVWTVTAGVLLERGFALPALTLSYMPMSHTGGRAMLYSTLGAGGTAYFAAASDLSTMLDDLRLVRPTQLNFVPRVWEMLHSEFLNELQRRPEGASEDDVLADMRTNILGGRYISALTGSAPISSELAAWAERLISTHLMNAFGATESGAVIIDGKVQRANVIDYKLVDVPELGYFSTDKPHPRGELLLKSRTMFHGYFKRAALTAEVFDEDGFYRTGDVVAEMGPDELQYVDRRNNVLKLSQGEFVTVSKLEAIYANCELVQQIYIYGNSERSYLLAVVVPTDNALANHQIGALKPLILQSLQAAARRAGLEPYEIPHDIIVEPSPFTPENGLLSGIRKPSRPNLKARYGEQLEQLYSALTEARHSRLRELGEHSA